MFQGPRERSDGKTEIVLTNIKGISNRVYYIILDVRYKNQLELESTNGIILKGTKSRSLKYNNTYRRCQQYKGAN